MSKAFSGFNDASNETTPLSEAGHDLYTAPLAETHSGNTGKYV